MPETIIKPILMAAIGIIHIPWYNFEFKIGENISWHTKLCSPE